MMSANYSIVKNLFPLTLIISFLSLTCCSDDETNSDEINCTENITFALDGQSQTQSLIDVDGTGPSAAFQLKDPSPFDSDKVSRAFGLITPSLNIVLEINVDDAESCIPLGIYDANTLSGSEGLLTFSYAIGFQFYLVGLGDGSGSLEITECDFENKTISGNFNATLVTAFGNESITITNGVFENVCLSE